MKNCRRTAARAAFALGAALLLGTASITTAAAQSGDGSTIDQMAPRDAIFVVYAAFTNNQEIEQALDAVANAATPEVRAYAQHIIDDHMAAQQTLLQLAALKNVALPTTISTLPDTTPPPSQGTDIAYDVAYLRLQIVGHQNAIRQFQREAVSGTDPDVVAYAESNLPTLEEHLREAQTLLRSIIRQQQQQG
jgi:putative membrane protein